MPIALEQMVKQLADSGIVDPGKLSNFIPPKAQPTSVDELARELIKQNHLTRFQAQQIIAGKVKALILGGYTVLDKIGAGGMGQVFKAQHRKMERLVAIKMLPSAMTKDAAALARFQREVVAAAKLRHPNIVAADDAAEANGVHFLVMEYVEGSDLSALVKKHGPFSVGKAVSYVLQAARGLEFAHGEGVIHRDIKPANLLLDRKGTVKILDMGLARIEAAGNVAAQAELTGTGAVMGTVDYMAPEQGMSTKHADARADIYSLGCTLHYLLIGKATYDGETVAAKLVAHHTHAIPELRKLRREVPEQVEAIFKKMVAKKIEDRYQTMSEVVADLEKCHSAIVGEAASTATSVWQSASGESSELSIALGNQKLKSIGLPDFSIQVPQFKPKPSSEGGSKYKKPLLIGAGAAGFFALLLGVIIIVRNDKGEEVGRMELAEGHTAQVVSAKTSIPKPPAAAAQPLAASASDFALDFSPERKSSVQVPDWKYDGNTPLTVEAWVTPRTLGEAEDPRFVVNGGGGGGFSIKCPTVSDGKWQFSLSNNEYQGRSYSKTGAGRRVHVAGVFDGREARLYLDGKSNPQSTPVQSPLATGRQKVTIGAAGTTTVKNIFDGTIDEVRISTVARYTSDFTPQARFEPDDKTEVLYHFDEGTGRVAKDTSSHHRDGKISGATWVASRGSGIASAESGAAATIAPPLAVAPFDAQQAKAHQAAWAKYLGTKVETTNSVGQTMILIPPGEFLMGSTDEQVAAALRVAEEMKADSGVISRIEKAERPQHIVVITKSLLMSATEVTIEQFKKFAVATNYQTDAEKAKAAAKAAPLPKPVPTYLNPGYGVTEDSPAAMITWNDATAYCQWLSTQEKTTYRLPTEAEWEYACRAGTTTQYSFGDDYNELPKYGWHNKNAGGKSHPVGTLLPNGFGLSDMHGNLQEWCGDYYDEKWYPTSPPNDPNGPSVGSHRVLRGGSWFHYASYCRSAYRNFRTPSSRDNYYGFRCVLVLDGSASLAAEAAARQPNHPWNTPAFEQWVKATQALPAEKQIEAVRKKLMELNPGFDGQLSGWDANGTTTKIENGVVTELKLVTDNVTNISPVRALPGLNILNCSGTASGKRSLSDLSPLNGMPLTNLRCFYSQIADLSPLKGMALKYLNCCSTPLSDLAPLQGMPLTYVDCNGSQVSDLLLLKDCKRLKSLNVTTTNVTAADVASLQKALPKCKIEWDGSAKVVLAESAKPWNTPGFQAWVAATQALPAEQQIEAVSKKLMELNPGFDGKLTDSEGATMPKIENGSVIAIAFDADFVTDISPVRALSSLRSLRCAGNYRSKCKLSDLSPLQGMHLKTLHCAHTNVSDLSPLHGILLSTLRCYGTQVSDLSPLRGMPLTYLSCNGTPVSDLTVLHDCTSLQFLDVVHSRATPASVAALQKALPNCKIEWDDPAKPKTLEHAAPGKK